MWPPFFFGAIPTYGVLPYAMISFTSISAPTESHVNICHSFSAVAQLTNTNVSCTFYWCMLEHEIGLLSYWAAYSQANLSHGCCMAGYIIAQISHTLDVNLCWCLFHLCSSYRMQDQLLCTLVNPIFDHCFWYSHPYCTLTLLPVPLRFIPECLGFPASLFPVV